MPVARASGIRPRCSPFVDRGSRTDGEPLHSAPTLPQGRDGMQGLDRPPIVQRARAVRGLHTAVLDLMTSRFPSRPALTALLLMLFSGCGGSPSAQDPTARTTKANPGALKASSARHGTSRHSQVGALHHRRRNAAHANQMRTQKRGADQHRRRPQPLQGGPKTAMNTSPEVSRRERQRRRRSPRVSAANQAAPAHLPTPTPPAGGGVNGN